MKTLSIVGFGTFGQFIAPYLTPHFEVFVWNRTPNEPMATQLGVTFTTLQNCLKKEIVVLCTNVSFFEPLLQEFGQMVNPNALVLDVASVKMKPIALMQRYLPNTCQIIGTHPLFGPQSGKHGIAGLRMVVCPERTTDIWSVMQFLQNELQLHVTQMTPEAHDKQMAYVQGLTHFIGRATQMMDIPDPVQKTKAYQHLLDVKTMLGNDSMDLFKSIEIDNPFAQAVRKEFVETLLKLEELLRQ